MGGRWAEREGTAVPLGARYLPEERAYNFALYSKHATAVTLEVYRPDELATPFLSHRLRPATNKSGRIWHCRLPEAAVGDARYYAYRVDGPHAPGEGQRYDAEKVLLDPYARAVFFPPAFSREAARLPGDNAGRAPLGVMRPGADRFEWGDDRRPRHEHDAVIYELHVRGFTRRSNSGVPQGRRGTFGGVADKIPYLKELGVTVVELMPVFQFDPQEANYWGYMPMGLFALHHAYGRESALGEQLDEFRGMVRALHRADIEVVLDVVCNHTAEGSELGPTYGFRGIDNTTYYLLEEDRARYRNDSGTGNVLHTANRYVRSMVLDALRYWVAEMHVDGFRFDLASLFTRASDGSVDLADPPIIAAIQSDPILSGTRLIAEAWDLASYQLGRTFPGTAWLQWNGAFRDQVRSFVRGDRGRTGDLARRLYGSDDLFPDTLADAFHPYQSVNFVTCHDGFCLYDLVAYDRKRNAANGHDGLDGTDENYSWNCGWEGDEGVPEAVMRLRSRQARNLLCLLMLANGTPMLVAGDEFLNTQRGNNNPYNQDNGTTWLDWDRLEENADFFRFARLLIAFRKAHPTVGRSRFWRQDAVFLPGDDRSLALHLRGGSEGDDDLFLMVNAGPEELRFAVPSDSAGAWCRVIDTSMESPADIAEPGGEASVGSAGCTVAPRSIVLLRTRRPEIKADVPSGS